MGAGSGYRTKQRDMLLCYLETVPGTHITVNDVCEHFKSGGMKIGKATIYRQMERFVDEGIVRKYVIDGTSAACFEYVGSDDDPGAGICFHCKCEKCGKVIHLRCDELEGVGEHLQAEHRFRIDPLRTVFYGLCENCM